MKTMQIHLNLNTESYRYARNTTHTGDSYSKIFAESPYTWIQWAYMLIRQYHSTNDIQWRSDCRAIRKFILTYLEWNGNDLISPSMRNLLKKLPL